MAGSKVIRNHLMAAENLQSHVFTVSFHFLKFNNILIKNIGVVRRRLPEFVAVKVRLLFSRISGVVHGLDMLMAGQWKHQRSLGFE